MRKYITIFGLIASGFILLTSESNYSNGSPGNRTGSPGDNGVNCKQCHIGSPQTVEDWIIFDENMSEGYVPGETYTITLNAAYQTANKYGFEMGVEDADNNIQGEWISTDNRTSLLSFSHTITHTNAGNIPSGTGETQWTMQWTAPAESQGDLTFYAAINAANGNGSTTGDHIFLTSKTISIATSIPENNPANVRIFPNPVSDYLQIENYCGELYIFSLEGKRIFSTSVNKETIIDVSAYDKGIYVVRLKGMVQKICVR
jgi:hypothetical protein